MCNNHAKTEFAEGAGNRCLYSRKKLCVLQIVGNIILVPELLVPK